MSKKYTRKSLRASEDESDISLQSITRYRSKLFNTNSSANNSNTTVLSHGNVNNYLLNNNHSSYNSQVNTHMAESTASSASNKTSFSTSSHLDRSTVHSTWFERFRWYIWSWIYLKIIRCLNFDGWLLSRIHKHGKIKSIFILMFLPLLFYFLWGTMHSISLLPVALSETANSILSSLLLPLSFLSSSSEQTEKVIKIAENQECRFNILYSHLPSITGIYSIFSGLFEKVEETATSIELHDTKDLFQSTEQGSLTEDEIRLVVMKIIEEKNLYQRSDNQRAQNEMEEKQKKLEEEIRNLKLELQSFTNVVHKIEEDVTKEKEKNGATLNIVSMSEEQKKQIDILNLKIKSVEAKLNSEGVLLAIEKHLIAAFKKITDGSADSSSKYQFFSDWLNSKFFNREKLLQEINVALKKESSSQVNVNHESVIKIIDQTVHNYVDSIKQDLSANKESSYFSFGTTDDFSEEKIRKIVKEAIMLYDADKTGKVDYALESGGGSVIGIRCSETYVENYGKFTIFNVPLWSNSNSPRTAIQPDVQPGQCWAFKGSQGYLVVKLSATIYPTGFTLEHIPVSLSRTGSIDGAPKNFSVWGLESEKDNRGTLLGEYWFDINGDPLQYFPVEKPNVKPYLYVELQINSNHGNTEYTCLYRFRVHGRPVS